MQMFVNSNGDKLSKDEMSVAMEIFKSLQLKRNFTFFTAVGRWRGGRALCQYKDISGKTKSAYRKNYDMVKNQIPLNHTSLHRNCAAHCVLNDGPLLTLGKDEDGNTTPVMMAVSLFDMNINMPTGSIAQKWLEMEKNDAFMCFWFLTLEGFTGKSLKELLGKKGSIDQESRKRSIRRGQTSIQKGLMIGAFETNNVNWRSDVNGTSLPPGQFHAVRGEMGPVGGKKDCLVREILDPMAVYANEAFRAWPIKMKPLHGCVSAAFDGSKLLSYTTILVTIGNRAESPIMTEMLSKSNMSHLLVDNAGKYIHVDERNAKGTPCVAIMFGAYEDFDFSFPTLGLNILSPSGTLIIGPFAELLHAVGGGTGVRLTVVYCQHEDLVYGYKKNSKGEKTQILTDARRSIKDRLRDEKAKIDKSVKPSAKIDFLQNYPFC